MLLERILARMVNNKVSKGPTLQTGFSIAACLIQPNSGVAGTEIISVDAYLH